MSLINHNDAGVYRESIVLFGYPHRGEVERIAELINKKRLQ